MTAVFGPRAETAMASLETGRRSTRPDLSEWRKQAMRVRGAQCRGQNRCLELCVSFIFASFLCSHIYPHIIVTSTSQIFSLACALTSAYLPASVLVHAYISSDQNTPVSCRSHADWWKTCKRRGTRRWDWLAWFIAHRA